MIELVREGFTTAEIAERLFIAPVTVRRHFSQVLHKLHVSDREEALRLLGLRSED